MTKKWELYERLAEALGHEQLADELVRAMDDVEANENLEHIAQMHDLK